MELATTRPGLRSPAPLDFATLYRAHFGFVWSTLRMLGVPPDAIEDALQEVFVVVHRRLADFEGRSSVRTWLFGISRRVAFRQRRGKARADRRVRAVAAQAEVSPAAETPRADPLLAEAILDALDELDDDKRTAIVLHVVHDMSGPEIAAMLEINVDTAYSRIKAARGRLRRTLDHLDARADVPATRRALRAATRPPREARRRMWALVAMRLGIEPGLGAPALAGGALAKGGSLQAILITVTLAGLVVLGTAGLARAPRIEPVLGGGVPTLPSGRARGEANVPHAPRSDPASATPPPTPAPRAVPAPTPTARPRPASPPAPRPAVAPTTTSASERLGEEVALLGTARTALDEGRPADALAALREHTTRFADGQLTVERQAYLAIAECEGGRAASGRPRARAFVRDHAGSPLAPRVRTSCDLDE